jgi:hypothetical protein
MKKVYVTQFNPNFTYEKANAFGEVVFLADSDLLTEPCPPKINDRLVSIVFKNLCNYNPGYDYILLSGSPAMILLVGTLLDNEVDHLVLRWDNRNHEYRVTSLNLGALDNESSRLSTGVS